MVIIERSEILKLLAQHNKGVYGVRKTADVITKLQAFLNPGARDDAGVTLVASRNNAPNVLNQDELYKLALILLTREKSTRLFHKQKQNPTKSEVLAQTLEDKFGNGKFQTLKEHFTKNNGHLTKDDFNRIVQDDVAENDQLNPSAAVQPADVNLSGESSNPSRPSLVAKPQELAMPAIDHNVMLRLGELSLSSVMGLSQTSRRYNRLFSVNQKILVKRDLLRQLLSHAALGELAAAEKIWSKHSDLLTCYGTVFHPNRIYDGDKVVGDIPFHHNPGRYKYTQKTTLQILWMNEDYDAAKLIEDRLSPDEWSRQFFEVFPDGMIKKDNFDLEEAKKLLQAVFDAIINDGSIHSEDLDVMNDKTRKALDALYAYAKPSNDIKTGLVFDANFYLAALALYDTKAYGQFKQKWAKYDFWSIRVEEWLAGCLGAGYFRPHTQGLGNRENRLIGCNLADGTSGFAFRRGFHSVPGTHFFVGYYGRRARRGGAREVGPSFGAGAAAFRELCQAKNNASIDLCKRATQTLKQNRIT